ncbi:MAG: hypothetical protein A2928_00520 [Candidatus Taylorbacteria bacterium RIFCSPLOWO2_01_FULL_45_15b]|uniref:Uncharacterized protein n=1 Tax=Candidatus Taylorbacteria bacterium RIFCSPLOWO2_01_FULL_45_15b TaxID=1802319 RepID=A0A1G2NCE2_9BACT|nr:MAG: hypothetical protein A2928_00520 [Candidatus Taylorbacteria bacterium RIFCSPLOWO2_01_FULL_45_15b]
MKSQQLEFKLDAERTRVSQQKVTPHTLKYSPKNSEQKVLTRPRFTSEITKAHIDSALATPRMSAVMQSRIMRVWNNGCYIRARDIQILERRTLVRINRWLRKNGVPLAFFVELPCRICSGDSVIKLVPQ